jgi:hypothetical protein
MPFIKRVKKGMIPAWHGQKAYEVIEIDDYGNPIPTKEQKKASAFTEPKIAPGVRAPDTRKGYKTPFNYRLWNDLRKQGKVGRK